MVARQKLRCFTQTPIPLISSTASRQQPTALKTPQGSHSAISKGKNIIISDNTGINSSISRGRMEVQIDKPDIPKAFCKGKGVLIDDGMDSYGYPIRGETLPCSVHDGLDSHKYMDLRQGAVRGDSGNCSRNIQSQFCSSYLPNDPEKPSHSAHIPPPEALELLSSSSNRRPKSSVYPSTVIRPSVSQPVEGSLPTPWGQQAIVDFHANLSGNNGLKQQNPQLPMDQYGRAKSSNDSALCPDGLLQHQRGSQVASAVRYAQVQPSGVNPLGQELLSQSGYTQPQPSLLNLLGRGIFTKFSPPGQDPNVVPQYMQPQPNYVNPAGQNGILLQPVLPHGEVTSDPRYFNERELMKDNQQNSNAEFWNFQQHFLRGTTGHRPDLDLRLQTHNRRL